MNIDDLVKRITQQIEHDNINNPDCSGKQSTHTLNTLFDRYISRDSSTYMKIYKNIYYIKSGFTNYPSEIVFLSEGLVRTSLFCFSGDLSCIGLKYSSVMEFDKDFESSEYTQIRLVDEK